MVPLQLEGVEAPPGTPRKVNVRHTAVKATGHIVPLITTVENLPEHCTVRDLQLLMYDHLSVSIRQPIELRYWGKPLDVDKMLKEYAIKEHSEITVVVKPRLPEGVPYGSSELHRIRFASHNLQKPFAVEGVSNDMTVLDLKVMVQAHLKANPIYLAIVTAPEDERAGTVAIKVGDQFYSDSSAPGKGGKGVMKLRRVKDGSLGTVNEADVPLLVLQPEQMTLLHDGVKLMDDAFLGSVGLVNNEQLYLDFKPPWPQSWLPEDGSAPPKGGGAEKKGAKKKK
ncbi:hypothetical protein AB1Y20_017568 [Prymnesium parvum]|uniref:Ubiquitin-like domain-containing protein n=1 Tax=Prymnesium parvum TaxID=97485 RepID=A0AB34JNK3_PRYPA